MNEGTEQEAPPAEEAVAPAPEVAEEPATEEPATEEPAEEPVAEVAAEEPVADAAAEPAAEEPAVADETVADVGESALDAVSIWPFVAYDLLWLAFAGVLVWQMLELPAGVAVFDSGLYGLAIIGGITLTVAGPLLILAVWLSSIGKTDASSGAVFISALIRGAVATLLGVTLWWVALIVIDQLRLGRLF